MFRQIMPTLSSASRLVLGTGPYRLLASVLGVGLTFMYMVLLPSLILGRITVQALAYITPVELIFSILMGPALSLVLVMNVYALRRTNACSRKAAALSIVTGVVPNSLCCTTVIPTVIGFVAASTSVLFTASPAIQAFLARYAVAFYFVSFLSLLYSLQLISRNIVSTKSGKNYVGG
jgi:hypothetical protein